MRVEDLGRLHEYVGARVASLASSLKFRLAVASVAALAAGIGITSAVLATRTETDTLVAQYKLEAHEAERTARQLGMRLRHQQAALAAAAGQLEPAWFDDPPRLLEYLRTKPVLLAQFDSVFIAGANGAMRLIHDDKGFRQQEVQLADRDYFRMALSEGRAVVSDLIIGRVAAIPVIVLAQPVKGHVGNAGVIGGALRITSRDLLASVADASTDEHGELVVVADAQGRIVAHPDAKMIGQPLASEPRLAVALERRRAAQAGTAAGAAVGTAAGTAVVLADERIVAIGQVPGASWTVWRSRLRADVLAPLTAGRTLAMRWAAGLVVVLAIGVVALLWWLLQPLSRLQRRAEHLFDGSSDAQAGWPEAGGEIGQLERVLRHVSAERNQLEAFNSRVIQRLESVMAAAPIGIAFTASKRFEMVSRQFCQLLGREESALLGQPAQLIYGSSDDYARVGLKAGAAFAAGQAYDGEWSLLRGDGQRFWARLRGQPVDWGRADAGTIWTVHDITHEVSSRDALEWAATDGATVLRKLGFARTKRRRVRSPTGATSPDSYLDNRGQNDSQRK